MKLVLAHDYLIQMGGAERVVATMHGHYPQAPILTSAADFAALAPELRDATITTTWMQHLPFVTDPVHFKKFLPLYPIAFRSFPSVRADGLWVSCSTFAKYVRRVPGVPSLCYLHNTPRFLWQGNGYVKGEVRSPLVRLVLRMSLPAFRASDRRAAASHSLLVANSQNVRQRILRHYGLESHVIHPPVDCDRFSVSVRDGGYHLAVSRLLTYKNLGLAVEGFTQTNQPLKIVGEGPDLARIKSLAGPTVEFLGRLSDIEIADLYASCTAFLLPGEEDFGITPLEAMACGKPVVALGRGGALESVVEGETGLFFHKEEPEALMEAVRQCRETPWDPARIRARALEFSPKTFLSKTDNLLRELLA